VTLDETLSFEVLEIGTERATATVTIDDRHRQRAGLIHGGVYAALAELLASEATAAGGAAEQNMTVMGMANSTHFIRALTGGTIRAEADALHRGRTTWIWDVRFADESGRTCAISRVTIALRPKRDGAANDQLRSSA
jgi:1,4-dihydroxy-2-naphthoyl-CoA hydrolase